MILAASVCTRAGKVLLSRQFQAMNAEKVQTILSRLPRLATAGSQHTVAEAEGVRYVYEPVEDLYLVLLTDTDSNIVQDLKTLRLLVQTLSVCLGGVPETERLVAERAFDIIMAFDEVVAEGYSEDLTPNQVETFLEMDSHEEKIQQIIERNKELEAAEERKKRAKELEAQRRATARQQSATSMSSNSALGSNRYDGYASPFTQDPAPQVAFEQNSLQLGPVPVGPGAHSQHKPRGRGLQLGKKSREEQPLMADIDLPAAATPAGAAKAAAPAVASPVASPNPGYSTTAAPAGAYNAAPAAAETEVTIAEGLTIETTRDGQVQGARVSGTLHVLAADRANNRIQILTRTGGSAGSYKTNPKMDRALFARQNTLGLRDANEGFPASNVLLVKWTVDNIKTPITFNVWVSEASDPGFMTVTLEYEVDPAFEGVLENVGVSVPLPTSNAHVSDPSSVYDQFDDHLVWMLPLVSGADAPVPFEFTAEADTEDDFFPMQVEFTIRDAPSAFGLIDVENVLVAGTQSPVPFSKTVQVKTESYVIR